MSSVPQTPLDKAAVDMSIGVVARTVALKAKNNNRSVPEYLGTTRHASVADPDSLLILPQVAKAYREALAGSTDAVPAGWTADDVAAARAFLRIADAAPGTAEISRESLAPLYPHATTVTTPNFGSFGGAPLPVTAVQHAIQQALVDGDVDHFLRLRLFADLEDSHRAVAQLMGLPNTKNITFCDNAADGFNIIAQSVIFNPVFYKKVKSEAVGPGGAPEPLRIMMMSNAYPMTKTAVAFWINRHLDLRDALGPAAASLWSYEVTQCPLTEEMVLSLNNETPTALIDGIADRAIACKADVVLIDHVAFAPAFIVPVDAICRKIKAANPKCFIILDAAHAIGAIDLKPHFGAATPPPFDAWFSNLHKWLMAPKHLAVLWHSDDYADYFHPNTISNLYRGVPYDDLVAPSHNGPRNRVDILRGMGILYDCQDPAAQRRAEFFWRGTRDHSCALVIPELLWFRRQLGEARIRAHNNRLAFDAAATMGKIWGTELLIRRSEHLSSMANVALPEDNAALVQRVIALLLTKHAINLPVFPLGDKMYARISGQVFNDTAVYETVARAVLACFEEVKANP